MDMKRHCYIWTLDVTLLRCCISGLRYPSVNCRLASAPVVSDYWVYPKRSY